MANPECDYKKIPSASDAKRPDGAVPSEVGSVGSTFFYSRLGYTWYQTRKKNKFHTIAITTIVIFKVIIV